MNASLINPILLKRTTDALGVTFTATQRSKLETFAGFLVSEGIAAGGLGPHEEYRIYDRHIADSLAFLRCIPKDVRTIGDVGSGIGLPGIPVAIARPECTVTLIDRSQRRCDLARRGARIAGVENVTVRQADAATVGLRFDCVLFRASLPLPAAVEAAPTVLAMDGYAVFAVSRQDKRPDLTEVLAAVPDGWSVELVESLRGVLDSPAWLLRMSSL